MRPISTYPFYKAPWQIYQVLWQFLLGTVLLCSTAVYAETHSENNVSETPPVIVVLGDSLSANYGIDAQDGWVHLLDEALKEQNLNYHIVNASISGETTGQGLARLPDILETHQPAYILVELGANDGLRGYPLKVMKGNLSDIISLSQDAGAEVLLIGVQIPLNYGARYTTLFEASFVELAEQYNIPLVPTLLGEVPLNPELMQDDRLHPNAKAQPYLLDNVLPAVLELIQHHE